MPSDALRVTQHSAAAGPVSRSQARRHEVADVYESHFDFVWRSVRRLGVNSEQVDDVVQEVFVVVQRRFAEFERRSELRTWLFGIARHVVRTQARRARRKPSYPVGAEDEIADPNGRDAEAQLVALEGTRLLHALLDELDDDKRAVFVLAELEEMSGPQIAEALELPLSNVYARMRSARAAFDQAMRRHRARQEHEEHER